MNLTNNGGRICLVLSDEDIDQKTFNEIRKVYTEGEELKILRLAIKALANTQELPEIFTHYDEHVESCVSSGKTKKGAMKLNETKDGR